MKIVRKKGIDKLTISHNRGLFWFIIILILFFIVFLVYANQNFGVDYEIKESLKCESDDDCVPEICCHAATCVHVSEKPDCENMLCTMECVSGTMDCGGGGCGCVKGYCGVVVKG